MKHFLINSILAAAAVWAAGGAAAAVVQTFGTGSAVKTVTNAAHFELNTGVANDYVEDGLKFSFVGSADNDGCGYAGQDCGLVPALDYGSGFAGNYMATTGKPSYISISEADGSDFYRIEFVAGTGYLNLNGFWQTWNNGLMTGSGKFSQPTSTTVLGLADLSGFDEVRYFAFSSSTGTAAGFSAPAIDEVRVGVPEPGSLALVAGALTLMGGLRRRRSGQPRR
jgi:hypothetical protein